MQAVSKAIEKQANFAPNTAVPGATAPPLWPTDSATGLWAMSHAALADSLRTGLASRCQNIGCS
jgi:hypothetical protein